MKKIRMNVLGSAVVSAIAIGALTLTAGCESQKILKDRPFIPAPANEPPVAAPVAVQPAPAPAVVQPVLPVAPEAKPVIEKPIIVPDKVVPK